MNIGDKYSSVLDQVAVIRRADKYLLNSKLQLVNQTLHCAAGFSIQLLSAPFTSLKGKDSYNYTHEPSRRNDFSHPFNFLERHTFNYVLPNY